MKTTLKTTIATLALLAALSPNLAAAEGITIVPPIDGSIIDFADRDTVENNPINDIADSIGDHPVETPRIYSTDLVDAVLGKGGNGGGGGTGTPGKPGTGASQQATVKVDFGTSLKCQVAGTPSEFPDDLRIRNAGLTTIPADTQIKWKAGSEHGVAVLAQGLKPGQAAKLSNVLDSALEAGTPCAAKALGL